MKTITIPLTCKQIKIALLIAFPLLIILGFLIDSVELFFLGILFTWVVYFILGIDFFIYKIDFKCKCG